MPKRRLEITSCADCPFLSEDFEVHCRLDDDERSLDATTTYVAAVCDDGSPAMIEVRPALVSQPPTWCPLRSGSITLSLK